MRTYTATGTKCGPDIKRLAEVLDHMIPQSSRKLRLASPDDITWELDPNEVWPRFNHDLANLLEGTPNLLCRPPFAGDLVECNWLLTGRIGSLAIRSTVAVYGNGECASVGTLRAVQLDTPQDAKTQARVFAVADTEAYVSDAIHTAFLNGTKIECEKPIDVASRIMDAVLEAASKRA